MLLNSHFISFCVYLNINRQDQKRPVKKLVQPTVVSPMTGEGNNSQGGMNSDNPVATAAAIAAAAASAATGPFLQVISSYNPWFRKSLV